MRVAARLAVLVLVLGWPIFAAQNNPQAPAAGRPPIIDVHLHAPSMTLFGGHVVGCAGPIQEFAPRDGRETYGVSDVRSLCDVPVVSPPTDEEHQAKTLKYLEEYNITGLLLASPQVGKAWRAKAPHPERLILGAPAGPWSGIPLSDYRKLFTDGTLAIMGETNPQGRGLPPDHPLMQPYWDLAEELDVPVGIHMGLGAPAAAYVGESDYLASVSSPLLLEPVLRQHPRLRVYVMHAGWPMLDEMIALMYSHPQVYVDTGIIDFGIPRKEFHTYLKRLVEAGFGNRILFGSDQFIWPEAIPLAIEGVQSADFLTEKQKRDILYNNAVRFLRLDAAGRKP